MTFAVRVEVFSGFEFRGVFAFFGVLGALRLQETAAMLGAHGRRGFGRGGSVRFLSLDFVRAGGCFGALSG